MIDSKTLKKKLFEEEIILILEEIGCGNIKTYRDKVHATNPDGDNKNAICVYIDSLHVENFTRPEFQSKHFRDIISLVEFIEDISFPQAVKRICEICKFDYYSQEVIKKPLYMEWIEFVEGTSLNKYVEEVNYKPLPEKVLQQYYQIPNAKWLEEGIKYESQIKYEVGFDLVTGRITIPIRNEANDILGIKGRKLHDDNGNDKYIYLYSCPRNQILYGLNKTLDSIRLKNEAIVGEAEKFVIKLDGYDYCNTLGTGGKVITNYQVENLQRLGVPVTLALDKGVSDSEIQAIVKSLQYPVPFFPIYILDDKMDLMEHNESPCDNMDTWDVLYNHFRYLV